MSKRQEPRRISSMVEFVKEIRANGTIICYVNTKHEGLTAKELLERYRYMLNQGLNWLEKIVETEPDKVINGGHVVEDSSIYG